MEKAIIFILAVGFGSYFYYVEKIEKPRWEARADQVEVVEVVKVVEKEVPTKTPVTETPAVVESIAVAPVEPSVSTPQVKPDSSLQISQLKNSFKNDEQRYKTLKAELQAEIKRGEGARLNLMKQDPPFRYGRIKTSQHDKDAWYANRDAKKNAMTAEIDRLKARLSNLESTWRTLRTKYEKDIRALK